MSTGGDPSATTFGTQVPAVPSCNQPHSVKYKHGWPGLVHRREPKPGYAASTERPEWPRLESYSGNF